jgi:SAM-dependent methyltransferase
MPDIYASITAADPATLERLVAALELRAADLLRRGILNEFVSEITLPREAKVLEIGCGTGAVTRFLANLPDVSQAVGVDPSPVFIAKARELAGPVKNSHFRRRMAVLSPSRIAASMLYCFTRPCVTFQNRRKPSRSPCGCSALEAGLRFLTATTLRRRSPSETSRHGL